MDVSAQLTEVCALWRLQSRLLGWPNLDWMNKSLKMDCLLLSGIDNRTNKLVWAQVLIGLFASENS